MLRPHYDIVSPSLLLRISNRYVPTGRAVSPSPVPSAPCPCTEPESSSPASPNTRALSRDETEPREPPWPSGLGGRGCRGRSECPVRAPRGARGWYSPGWEGRAAALWLERGKREQGLFSIKAAATGNSSEAAGGQRSRRSQWQPRPGLSGARGRGSSRSPGTPRSTLRWNRPGTGPRAAPGLGPALSSAHPARPGLAVPSLGWAGSAGPKESAPGWGARLSSAQLSRGFGGAAGAGASPTDVGSAPLAEVWDTPGPRDTRLRIPTTVPRLEWERQGPCVTQDTEPWGRTGLGVPWGTQAADL